jgi:uncharacterized protein YhaN
LERLYETKEAVNRKLKDTELTIIAGNIVNRTIEQLQQEEDEKLEEVINSAELSELLLTITGRYHSLAIRDDELKIQDKYEEYNLKDLSTGTREQVLLALRMAFAKRLFKQQSAFLIFDDAFQHSDFERRPRIIENLINMAVKSQWQIIYFTMDEHIRNEFQRQAGQLADFNYIELPKSTLSDMFERS